MTVSQWLSVPSALLLSFFSCFLSAVELGGADYRVFHGDINGDGASDLYLEAQPQIVILHGEISVPLALPPKGPNLWAAGSCFVAYCSYYSLQEHGGTSTAALSDSSYKYHSGDFNGDGISDAFLQAASSSNSSIILHGQSGTSVPTVAQALDSSIVASNVASVRIYDNNGDGKDDVVILQNGETYAAYFGDAYTMSWARIWHYGEIDTGSRPMAVGAIGGSHRVGNDGGASYSIPIIVSPGAAGMQPTLSFGYSSNGGNGLMGQGWGLSGQSSIVRCPATLVDDGFVDGVDFDSNDRFCLDGLPLIAVSGSYGASGTEYRTQTETFSKIISSGSVGSCVRDGAGANFKGPQKFTVITKIGQTLEYGYTADSRVEAVGCSDVIKWAVNKQEDHYGNAVTYGYTEDSGEHILARIDYNNGGSSVEFGYVERQDKSAGFVLGTPFKSTQLLQQVKSFEGSALVREYQFAYGLDPVAKHAQIVSMVECSPAECLPSTTMTWSGVNHSSSNAFAAWTTPNTNNSIDVGLCKSTLSGDVNGDGLTDMICPYDYGSSTATFVQLANGSDGFTNWSTWSGASSSFDVGNCKSTYTADVNGDGLTDLACPYDYGSQTRTFVQLSQGNSFSGWQSWSGYSSDFDVGNCKSTLPADVNGDGITDLVCPYDYGSANTRTFVQIGSLGGLTAWSTWAGLSTSFAVGNCKSTMVADVNSDGLDDLVCPYDYGSQTRTFVQLSSRTAFSSWTAWNPTKQSFNIDQCRSLQQGDINGDGVLDLVCPHDSGSSTVTYVQTATGAGYSDWKAHGTSQGFDVGNCKSTIAVDLNADGLTDLACPYDYGSETRTFVQLASQTGYSAWQSWNAKQTGFDLDNCKNTTMADVDGDGQADLICPYDHGSYTRTFVQKSSVEAKGLLASVTNGFGVETQFSYKLLNDPSIYTQSTTGGSYPIKNITGPIPVVDNVEQSNGIGGFSSTSYSYKGLKTHMTGLGSLGFSEMTTTNEDTGISTTVTFSQNYSNRLQGSVDKVVTTTAEGIVTSDTRNTWQQTTLGSGTSKRYMPVLYSTEVSKRDLNGAFLHREMNTYANYDSYGNLGLMVSKLYDQSNNLLRTTKGYWGFSLVNGYKPLQPLPLLTSGRGLLFLNR